MTEPTSKPVRIGEWMLGYRNVELFADPELLGGSFMMAPEKGAARITVGTRYDYWREVFEVLIHESMEFAFCEVTARYKPNPTVIDGHDGYLFCADHNQFSDAVARSAQFVVKAQHDLCKIHRKHITARKRRKKHD